MYPQLKGFAMFGRSATVCQDDVTQTSAPVHADVPVDVTTSRHALGTGLLKTGVVFAAIGVLVLLGLLAYLILAQPPAPRTMAELKIQQAEAAVNKKPADPGAQMDLGSAYLEVGKDSDAIEHLEVAVKLAPNVWLTHYALGNAYVVVGETKKAIEQFELAIVAEPSNGAVRYGLGELYLRNKNYKKAATVLEGATVVEPTAADTRVLLGKAYEKLGRKTDAAAQYREALRYAPGLAEASAGLKRTQTGGPQ